MNSSAEYNRKWRKLNPDKVNAQNRRYREKYPDKDKANRRRYGIKLRTDAVSQLGGICVHCGIKDIRVLTIDHVNGNGSSQRKLMSSSTVYRKIRDVEIDLCLFQVLCWNCNFLKYLEKDKEKGY